MISRLTVSGAVSLGLGGLFLLITKLPWFVEVGQWSAALATLTDLVKLAAALLLALGGMGLLVAFVVTGVRLARSSKETRDGDHESGPLR